MWTDNETAQDFLNFGGIAKTVAEIIEQAQSRPISIGVSGAWGVGKSSMIKLIRTELSARHDEGSQPSRFIFVEFNAWLYQGYDDARTFGVRSTRTFAFGVRSITKNMLGLQQVTRLILRV
ncbi:MAG: P-loop NTPase fold protein [Nitrosomonas sp.]|uniref:P-loop NTPase fold protein n=1 Tax=Nitrosomonas sp. TaxID=42353 RepID=UPI002732E786|nr:P-loop NTPase fold protein [Nitrosomonas sp.]MDP3664519.1 P-loop NTPase fold protein [Nitrosomonas sp.]MDZ4105949.1 P-loop NTPase fold protein [Nitrosomonas sp.]